MTALAALELVVVPAAPAALEERDRVARADLAVVEVDGPWTSLEVMPSTYRLSCHRGQAQGLEEALVEQRQVLHQEQEAVPDLILDSGKDHSLPPVGRSGPLVVALVVAPAEHPLTVLFGVV